jgi:hypothetical protein
MGGFWACLIFNKTARLSDKMTSGLLIYKYTKICGDGQIGLTYKIGFGQ